MLYLIAGIILLGILTAIIHYFGSRKRQNEQTATKQPAADSDCCGAHEVCERDSLLAAAGKKIEYYDDEELDAYRGIPSDAYSDEAVEAFREVLYTMQEKDVAGWLRSLQLREINLPDPLKDETFLIVGERRKKGEKPRRG